MESPADIELEQSPALARRALLGVGLAAGVGGAAVSLLPLLSGRVGASSGTDESTAPTTTAPPQRPTNADVGLLAAAQQVELTVRDLYDEAIAAGGWSDQESTVIVTIREAHEASAQALAGMLGVDAPNEPSEELFRSLSGQFRGGERLLAAYALESAVVATHGELLATLAGTDGATLIAAIQFAEARHGTVLADLAGETDDARLLVETEEAPLDVTA